MSTSVRRRCTSAATTFACVALALASGAPRSSAGTVAYTNVPAVTSAAQGGAVTYHLDESSNPSADEKDAYARITAAMDAAVARYNRLSNLDKTINVYYSPGTPTADGNINGTINFGSDRGYMTECTALHEIAHTIGVGQSGGWYALTDGGGYHGAEATALEKSFDGPDAVINTGGGHFWPYGMNYDDEFNETAADRHVELVQAMVDDGM